MAAAFTNALLYQPLMRKITGLDFEMCPAKEDTTYVLKELTSEIEQEEMKMGFFSRQSHRVEKILASNLTLNEKVKLIDGVAEASGSRTHHRHQR